MKLHLTASMAFAGLFGGMLSVAQAQMAKPVFNSDNLQITPERLRAFEAALAKPLAGSSTAEPDFAALQERLSKAKSEAEAKKISAEFQAQLMSRTKKPTGGASIREPYDSVVNARQEWEDCAARAGEAEASKVGEANAATNPAARSRVEQARKRELAACGARPTFPSAPVPSGWTGSGRSFYVMLDRVNTYCSAIADNPDLELKQGSGGTVGWDSGSLDESRQPKYHVYLSSEVQALKPRCAALQDAINNAE